MTATDRPGPAWVATVGRIGGTEIQVSASCLLLVALLAVAVAPRAEDLVPGLGALALLVGTAVGILVYAAALVHEMAHAAVARRHGHVVPTITIAVGGGRTLVRGESRTPGEEATIAVAGPLVSLVIGLGALALRAFLTHGIVALVLEALVLANLLIGLLDLLPAPPLDGGRLVRAAAWRVLGSRHRGAIVAARIGRGVALALVLVPVLTEPVTGARPPLSLWAVCLGVAVIVWSSTGEGNHRWRAGLEHVPVGHLVRPVLAVGPDVAASTAWQQARDRGVERVVVVDDGRATGLLEVGGDAPPDGAVGVAAVPLDPAALLAPDATADQVVSAMTGSQETSFLVVAGDGSPRGMIHVCDVEELRGLG